MRNDLLLTIPGQLAKRAQQRGDHPFLIFEKTRLTYEQAHSGSTRLAGWLVENGLERGDRVLLLLDNSVELVLALLGVATAGGVAVPVNPQLTRPELAPLIRKSTPKFGICLATARDRLPETLPSVVMGRGRPRGAVLGDLGSLLRSSARGRLPEVDPEDAASFVFTSGTSGEPKAVVQSHRTYVVTGESFPYWMGLTDKEVLYTCLPLFHINAQAYSLMSAVCGGVTLALGRRFSASTFWGELMSVGASQFNAIGSMLMVLFQRSRPPRDLATRVCYSAPAFDPETHIAIEGRFKLKLLVGYGLSESPFGTITPLNGDPGLGSVGKPRIHPDRRFTNEVRVAGADSAELPPGETGEIILRNQALMNEYWGDTAATKDALRDGWLFTGDQGRMEGGFLYYVGRKAEMIRRRGENISPVEVEAALQAYPEVGECAVFGVPSELSEEEVAVAIVPGDKFDLRDFIRWSLQRLAPYKVPRFISLVDSLPKGPTQKVVKGQLVAAWRDGDLASVDRAKTREEGEVSPRSNPTR